MTNIIIIWWNSWYLIINVKCKMAKIKIISFISTKIL